LLELIIFFNKERVFHYRACSGILDLDAAPTVLWCHTVK